MFKPGQMVRVNLTMRRSIVIPLVLRAEPEGKEQRD